MPSKYDTNPLDPEFPSKSGATKVFQTAGTHTQQFPPPAPTEEQTRRFGDPNLSSYSMPYTGQYMPAVTQAASFSCVDQSRTRKVAGLGLPENILVAAPYFPWYIGLVAGALILLLVPKSETKVRFHAAQGLAAHIGILIVTTILGVLGNITGVAEVGNIIFQIATTIMLVIFAVKAWKGKPIHIESIDGLTNWLEDKISPKLTGN